jgi:hypothetical protein
MLLLLTDLEQLGEMALQDFGREMGQAPPAGKADLERYGQRLEAKLEQLYAVAATIAQREEGLEGVAAIWGRMVSICDRMAQALSGSLHGPQSPLDSYDRVSDIRNVCEDNRALHSCLCQSPRLDWIERQAPAAASLSSLFG